MMSAEQLTPSVTFPSTTATHVLGDTSVTLATGDLCLYITPPTGTLWEESTEGEGSQSTPIEEEKPILTLSVGKAAFPLFRSTVFGTVDGDERVYLFTPNLGAPGGYVKITLPEGVADEDSMLSTLQEEFEQVLVAHGLLKEGLEAAADELGRGVVQGSSTTAQGVREQTTDHPACLPNAAHTTLQTSASATQTLLSAAQTVSSAVGNAASSAGSWVSSHLASTRPPTLPPKDHPRSSHLPDVDRSFAESNTEGIMDPGHLPVETSHPTSKLGGGSLQDKITPSYSSVSSFLGESAHIPQPALADSSGRMLQNEYGEDVRKGASEAGGTAGNLGGIAMAGAKVGSGGAVVDGVTNGTRESWESKKGQKNGEGADAGCWEGEQGNEDRSEDAFEGEMNLEKEGSGQWVDLSV